MPLCTNEKYTLASAESLHSNLFLRDLIIVSKTTKGGIGKSSIGGAYISYKPLLDKYTLHLGTINQLIMKYQSVHITYFKNIKRNYVGVKI